VVRADGRERVEFATLTDGRREWTERCDLLCCSYGLVPATELARLIGCEISGEAVRVDPFQRTSISGVLAAGEVTGIAGDESALAEGEVAGLVAAGRLDEAGGATIQRRRALGVSFRDQLRNAFAPRDEVLRLATPDTIICRCEDVRLAQLDRDWSGRQAKLYTRMGMGPCQGAICGGPASRIFGWEQGTVRPPLFAPDLGSWFDSQPE
jgi:NADPH-dependent 2,4-dienoyl-CoA reductase/sulfur reductase-like enzyme